MKRTLKCEQDPSELLELLKTPAIETTRLWNLWGKGEGLEQGKEGDLELIEQEQEE